MNVSWHSQTTVESSSGIPLGLWSWARWGLLALVTASGSGCANPLNPEAGLAAPRDPGTILVLVREESGGAVQSVQVFVEIPNAVGVLFKIGQTTGADGRVEFKGVPAGRRRVELFPPVALTATNLIRDVDVVEGRTIKVEYVLIHSERSPLA
jgi:hypothetical protein